MYKSVKYVESYSKFQYHNYLVTGVVQYGADRNNLIDRPINREYRAISPLHARIWILIDMSDKYPSPRWKNEPTITRKG